MFDLQKYDVTGEPVVYPLHQIPDWSASLTILPGTEKNKPYHTAVLKRNAKRATQFRAGVKITREMLKESRDEDRILYAKHVIVGWEGVQDTDGQPVSFGPDVCRQFLHALPDWIFDDLRLFAANPVNFLKDDEPDETDVEAAAGN